MAAKKAQKIAEDAEREDRFNINIATARLALAIYDTRARTDFIEKLLDRSSNKEISVHVFGKDGVGGITSDKVCVQLDNKNAKVWLDNDLFNLLLVAEPGAFPQKSEIIDKLHRVNPQTEAVLGRYSPIFKALSNCGLSITDVIPTPRMEEVDSRLTRQQDAIENLEVTEEALARYRKYGIVPQKPLAEELNASRIRFESEVFENELGKELDNMSRYEVFKVLNAPGGKKVNVYGFNRIGTVIEDTAIVQLDTAEAKIFLEKNVYSEIESRLFKNQKIPASDAASRIMQSPEVLTSDPPLPSILKTLSKLNINVSELSPLEGAEFVSKAELLVEQNWIASNVARSYNTEGAINEILKSVKDRSRINDALTRYGFKVKIEKVPAPVEKEETAKPVVSRKPAPVEKEETAKPVVSRKPLSQDQLESELSKRLELTKNKMVDEEVGNIGIVGFGGIKVLNMQDDIVINCNKEKATIIIEEDILSAALKHAKLGADEEDKLIDNLAMLEGKKGFTEFVAAVKALKKAGIEKFTITTYGHDADYYLDDARRTCAPPATLIEGIASGKSIGDGVKILAGSVTVNNLIEALDKTGFSEYAKEVSKYVEQAKILKGKFNSMIDGWVKNKVPDKAGLLECASSLGMSPKEFEVALGSAASEMRESNTRSERSIEYYQNKLDREDLVDAMRKEFKEYMDSDNKSINENNARIKKIEEALKALRGS